ncbi:Dam family site-specific DNA-(adenine-N6)-methyltransferase [Gallibacterium trehalosifermentans]|uniref:Site-specific DNA-methyltransferase (adenine-specific) n=1 Tax=Gallibacterium trehalosifermentans TaxID=516935 RepID=A0ABV6H038_9PAST
MSSNTHKAKHRSFLKWAGGKYRLVDEIKRLYPQGKTQLIEPFVGAGTVFLNSEFEHYLLADINPDLINLFKLVKSDVKQYIKETRLLFTHPDANTALRYYSLRDEFNRSTDLWRRATLFLYLNRFGFNGLCRYNSDNEFNVPFGAYRQHYFPENELHYFAEKAQAAEFICASFDQIFTLATAQSVVYCDPPYAPLQQDSNFTRYSGNEFSLQDQKRLAELAYKAALQQNATVLISNHDTRFTRDLYQGAKISKINVQRSISQASERRVKVKELIAVFSQQKLLQWKKKQQANSGLE